MYINYSGSHAEKDPRKRIPGAEDISRWTGIWMRPRLVGYLVQQRRKGAAAGASSKVSQGSCNSATLLNKQADRFCARSSIGHQVGGLLPGHLLCEKRPGGGERDPQMDEP